MKFLIGAGGHATSIIDVVKSNGEIVDGVFSDFDSDNITGLRKIGKTSDLNKHNLNNEFMLAFGNIEARKKIVESLENKELNYFSSVHSSCIIGSNVSIGTGVVIMPGAIINSGAKIGKHVIINSGVIIEHGCIIEDYVHVSPKSVICGNCVVGSGSWIGAGATIINNIKIGTNVVVGAGSVIINNVDDNCKVAGVPAKKI